MKAWGIILAVLTILFAVGSWFVYSGIYSVAATQPHTSFERWLFITLRDQSIEQHPGDIEPPLLNDATLIQTGARHYGSTCAVCHGAPGQELSAIVKGLNPVPPELHTGKIQKKYSDAELYWIVHHGIRMTGMPAFGHTFKEKDLWAIVAFIKRLPEVKPEEYKSMAKPAGHHHAS